MRTTSTSLAVAALFSIARAGGIIDNTVEAAQLLVSLILYYLSLLPTQLTQTSLYPLLLFCSNSPSRNIIQHPHQKSLAFPASPRMIRATIGFS